MPILHIKNNLGRFDWYPHVSSWLPSLDSWGNCLHWSWYRFNRNAFFVTTHISITGPGSYDRECSPWLYERTSALCLYNDVIEYSYRNTLHDYVTETTHGFPLSRNNHSSSNVQLNIKYSIIHRGWNSLVHFNACYILSVSHSYNLLYCTCRMHLERFLPCVCQILK